MYSLKEKRKVTAFIILTFFIFSSLSLISACGKNEKTEYTGKGVKDIVIDYNESTENILNPDRGFYTPNLMICAPDGISGFDENLAYKGNLVHMRMDISAFSGKVNGEGDIDLSEKMLNDLNKIFKIYREKGACAVIRFCYDPRFGGTSDLEPSIEYMEKHIEQLGPILKEYRDVLSAVEVGMVGPWGEMHTSKIAKQETWNRLIEAFLSSTDNDTCILVRQPNFCYRWMGYFIFNLPTSQSDDEKERRVGVFNDGYLGSYDDLGTYTDREKETAWLSVQAQTTLFGGEVTVPGSEFNKIDFAAKEMFITHTSYLNLFWNDTVVKEWKDTIFTAKDGKDEIYSGKTAFEYIENHLGYRFVLRKSEIPSEIKKGKDLNISGVIENVGFGNVTKKKLCEIILKNEAGTHIINMDSDVTKWYSRTENSYSAVISLPEDILPGKYEVYLRIRTPSENPLNYSIRFANNGIWNSEVSANRVGTVTIK